MKWFKHFSDSHTNGKMRQILRKHGLEGYAFCWICRELVAKEGEKYRIKPEKEWKTTLKEETGLDEKKIDNFLNYQAEVGAICHKSLEKGDLYIPKMRDYSDNYSKYIKSNFKDTSKQLTVEEKRIEENRKEENKGLLNLFSELHKGIVGVAYSPNYGKDKKLLYDLMDIYDDNTLKALIEGFFDGAKDPAEWWFDKTLSIGMFKTLIPQIITRIRRKK